MSKHTALIVRGGWEGHDPFGCTEKVMAGLLDDFDFDVAETMDAYVDRPLSTYDLIIQCWSMGTLTPDQESALVSAVEAGTGFAGWHGGVIGTCVANARYLRMVGGRFLWHPDGFQHYRVTMVPEYRDHPITRGVGDFDVNTEHYWLLSDAANTVLATTSFSPDPGAPWHDATSMPVTWTRRWGKGNVFVCTLGHNTEDLEVPETAAMIQRGLLWATRMPAAS